MDTLDNIYQMVHIKAQKLHYEILNMYCTHIHTHHMFTIIFYVYLSKNHIK
jgi:hypothetical protein